MAEEVPKKSFDPKKSAVALKYDRAVEIAPKLVAKGKGSMADQIIMIAELHGIEVREDADLVGILEKLDIDSLIPIEAYAAVAEILSYVYKSNARMREKAKFT